MLGSLYGKPKQLSTAENVERLKKEVGHIKIKHFEEILTKKINELPELRKRCIDACKRKSLSNHGQSMLDEVERMMSEKTDYEWSNTCSNSLQITECRDYIRAMSDIDYYIGRLKLLSDNGKKMLDNFKESIKPTKRDSIASTVTISDISSDNNSELGSNDSQLV
jgi:archaellum component FlaC